jgi:hypothetical protein
MERRTVFQSFRIYNKIGRNFTCRNHDLPAIINKTLGGNRDITWYSGKSGKAESRRLPLKYPSYINKNGVKFYVLDNEARYLYHTGILNISKFD